MVKELEGNCHVSSNSKSNNRNNNGNDSNFMNKDNNK